MPKNVTKNSKNPIFIFLYAIGTILIVNGHCGDNGLNLLFNVFNFRSFHLGLFMFCSGYFYKSKNESEFIKYVIKKFKKFIIPIYLWNLVYVAFIYLTRLKGFTIGRDFTLYNYFVMPLVHGQQFIYTLCLWYLPSLFLIEIITCLVRKCINKITTINEFVFFIIYFALGLLGVYLSNKGWGLTKDYKLLLVRTLYFFPFFGLGLLYNRKIEKHDNVHNYIYFPIVIILQLIIVYFLGENLSFHPAWCYDFTKNIFIPFITGFLGIAFWLRIAKIMVPITENSKIIQSISNNSYAIMIHQFLGFFIVKLIYAIISKYLHIFTDFSISKFKTDIWYIYIPKEQTGFLLIYIAAGILIPILINKTLNIIKEKIASLKIMKNFIKN